MKKNVLKFAWVFCFGLLAAELWGPFSVFAKNDSEKERAEMDLDTQLESEEAGLVEEEDVFWDNLEELEDDLSDVQLKIDQALSQGENVASFQKLAQEIKELLDRAEDDLEKEDWNKAKGYMDSALLKLKSLNESIVISSSAEYFDGEEEMIESSEVLPQESAQGQESVQQQDMPEKKKGESVGIVGRFFNWIAGLFS